MLLLASLVSSLAVVVESQSLTSTITVDWSSPIRNLKTVAGFQTVVNPLTTRLSPVHDQVFESIASLKANFQRYVPWLPYPKLGIAELEPPSGTNLCGFVNSGGAGNIWNTTLDCGGRNAGVIKSIDFASYGKPTGFCGSLVKDAQCDAPTSVSVVTQACVGKPSCTIFSNDETFSGAAPCSGGGTSLAIQVQCSAPPSSANFTYWDFKWLDEGMQDFIAAGGNRTTIPNFSTIPNWLFSAPRSTYPDDPLGETWSYEKGKDFVDASLKDLGDYYGRLLAHFVEGGFVDEGGVFVPGLKLKLTWWEVLNEIEFEHSLSPQLYAAVYDAIVSGIRRWAPTGAADLKFVGLALGNSGSLDQVSYFLNASNHLPGIPLDMISFHHYASAQRDGGDNGTAYEAFFGSGDDWLTQVSAIMAIRDALNPSVMMDADEVGVILADDNDPIWTSADPGFPLVYWNAAAASYAYLYGQTSLLGLDVLGESQLVGYPSFNFTRSDLHGLWTAPPQYPSVAMLNWTDGTGTARYWALKLLSDSMKPGAPAGTFSSTECDVLVNTSVSTSNSSSAGTNPFCGSTLNLSNLNLACFTPGATIKDILFASYGTPSGSCPSWQVGACNAANSTAIVKGYCLGKQACSIPAFTDVFGDPCYNVVKNLDVVATCSEGGGGQVSATAPVYAQAYLEQQSQTKKVLIVSKSHLPQAVSVQGATGATWTFIDLSTGMGPAASIKLTSDEWTLSPFSLGILFQ